MIEQEKAVQFRFDTSEKSLSERLTEIGLPTYVRLFSCVGLSNVFAWRNIERTESFQETWLYIPDSSLESMLISQRGIGVSDEKHTPGSNSFKLDNQHLYPIHSAGKLSCIIAVPEGKEFKASQVDLGKIEKIERTSALMDKADTIQIAYEFVSRLFDCKQSYAEFAQRLLNFLTDQVDKSYAGLYWKSVDSYHRRWAYGDLQLSDKLRLAVTSETVAKWKGANSCGKTFIPADLIQDEPVFVQAPPNFLFVYQTPNFGDREQWLVMAVPGDISGAAISRITIIASLLSSIDDERTTGYAELVSMFGDVLGKNRKTQSLEEALKLCYKLIDSKLRMNSMCLLDTDRSVMSCMKAAEDQLQIERNKVTRIPDQARQVIESLEPAYLDGPSHPAQDGKNLVEESDASHVLFPIPLKDGSVALFSAEFSSNLDRARHHQRLFELAAKYLGICISLSRMTTAEPQIIGTPTNEIAETMALARLKTISNLNGGYFHELTEFLSVILGQAEIMEYEIRKSTKSLTVDDLLLSTDRIVRAAASLADKMEKLKEVSTIKVIDDGNYVTADKFLSMLPALTYGYFLTVKDNKNVEIAVQTKADRNVSFSIPVLHIYDYIVPLILTIMEEALCSGTIATSLTEHFGRPALRISFAKKLLGKLTLEKLVDKVFNFHQFERSADSVLIVTAASAHFIFSECDGDRYQAIYTLTNFHHPIEEFN